MSSVSSSGSSDSSDSDSSGDSRDALSQTNLGAALSRRPLQRITPDEAWSGRNRYHDLAASGYTLPGQPNYRVRRPESDASTMAGSVATCYTGSAYAPSLAASVSTVASERSISTGRAGSSIYTRNVLRDHDAEVQERPALPGALICEFHYLNCGATFNNLQEWDTHSESHFYGGTLPKSIDCPFICEWSIYAETSSEGWRQRQEHIAGTHRFGGQRIDADRIASRYLIQHLWRERKIDRAQVQQLNMTGRLKENVIFVQNHGGTSDGRRQRRERH